MNIPVALRSAAPARPGLKTITVATLGSIIALCALALLTLSTGEPFLIPPMAASMALIMGAPQLPLSQPRNVIGGQMLSALVGITVGFFGDGIMFSALAGGLALGVMMLARMPHSPAAATAIIGVTTGSAGWLFVLLAGVSALILVIIGVVVNRLNKGKYPEYVW